MALPFLLFGQKAVTGMKTEILRMYDAHIGEKGMNEIRGMRLLVGSQELVNIIGVTGSGKSMLSRYFRGEEELSGGSVVFLGKQMQVGERFSESKKVICLGRQSTLLPKLSIAENICIITRRQKIKGIIPKKNMENRVNLLLQQFAPDLRAETQVKNLTQMQCHIVELLRAVESEAKMIYIDNAFEVYGEMDSVRMCNLLESLIVRGISIVYASRQADSISNLASRMIVIRKGKNVKTFYKEDFSRDRLRMWLAGDAISAKYVKHSDFSNREILSLQGVTSPQYLSGIDLSVHEGEIVGLYDMNYCANLELTDLLVKKQDLVSGKMLLDGVAFDPKSMEDAVNKKVGFIAHLQDGGMLIQSMSFAENLALPVMQKMSLLGMFRNWRLNEFLEREYHRELGIAETEAELPVRNFDAYTQMKIILNKWLLVKPILLVCEDICEEMDVKMQEIIYGGLSKLAKNKTGIVIASHHLKELEAICDTIYIMNSYGSEGERVSDIEKYYTF